MRALLDACVLYPTVLREMLVGAADLGFYEPLWSERILEEWARATRKLGPVEEVYARAEIAALKAAHPGASVARREGLEARLHLPDENDIHVLAAAIAGGADAIITLNRADFPRGILTAEGIERRDPDGFLWELWSHHPAEIAALAEDVRARAEAARGAPQPLRALLKRADLPRLGKALAG
ncbi:RSP_2648 family PIN domain-containing protein [Phaeovulum sp.]|uniref:RSP_2648 family PIN domain-containing protein n=1 Tax=Phaeovulum sp. TaxID=2934796 RepID=UPI00356A4F69